MVIPTKVDTSQVSQQNVNWMSAVKTQISKPAIRKTHLYCHYWSLNNTCLSECGVVTGYDQKKKNSLDLWSESFLNKHEIFLLKNTLKVTFIYESIIFKTSITLRSYKINVYNKKTANSNLNIGIMHILCMVIPTKVDTSQVPQQNVNWMSTVNAQISKPAIQKTHLYHH